MALHNIVIPRKEVPLADGQSFTVSGVSANQVFTLYQRHREDLSSLFDRFSGRTQIEPSDVMNSIEGIISQFPILVGEVIALASGYSPNDVSFTDDATKTKWQAAFEASVLLPLPVQADALFKVAELTFSPDMPPKKFFGLLVAMIQQANGTTSTSDSGSDS